ncbi:slipin family protein [Thiorhodococcus minor]|uniref:Slipin family protein n=1 Tax=Thiorhodococcus minor TaxID=57489 RepID=A0A6M0JVG5_9GAMM|nr:slipin family protein [Thiorhodococcus minor]NEV60593.1 slipin family protein [Thiorhodococcus minor]
MRIMGYKRQVVAQHERALVLKNGMLEQVLGPGVYHWVDLAGALAIEVYDLTNPELSHAHAEVFRKEAAALWNAWVDAVETADREAGLVYLEGRLTTLIPPMSRRFYWKGPIEVRVERVDLSADLAVDAELMESIRRMRHRDAWTTASPALREKARTLGKVLPGTEFLDNILEEEVADHEIGLLIQDGRLIRTLQPGVHAFWSFARNLQVEVTDLRLQELEVQGQEILTRDKVSLRINLSAHYRVEDPVKVRAGLPKYKDFLYRELQFGLRQAICDRTLDELLEQKGVTEQGLLAGIQERAEPYGIQVEALGIKDVILPGDMKQILNQVVEAEKAAQANLIRRREETAATRSLLNTAKLMDQNPVLLRLKELEALERVTERVGSLTVFGGMESLLQGLVRIEAPKG